jgi:tetratricopeptide (TPR) repeat protein
MLRLLFLAFLLLTPSIAHSQKRVALVVGNSAYTHAGRLVNPKNDASDMAAALNKVGFQVIERLDLDKAAFDRAVRDFTATIIDADDAVFYYAGHGIQIAGENYLIPTDAQLLTMSSVEFETTRVDFVRRAMVAKTNILILDACRNNPFARQLMRAVDTRSREIIGVGLATMKAGSGTLISFSTQPDSTASDGVGRNSPFTGPLVKHVTGSSDDLNVLLISVRNDVMQTTQGAQIPWEHSALTRQFYFKSRVASAAPPSAAQQPTQSQMPARSSNEAAEAWDRIKDTTSIYVLEKFIEVFKGTFYADLASAKAEELKKQQAGSSRPTAEIRKDCAQDKDHNLAIPACTELIRRNSKDANAYYNRGVSHRQRDEEDQALADYTKAIETDPKYQEAYVNRGVILSDRNEYDKAISDFTKGIELNPKDERAYANRAWTFTQKDDFTRAIRDYTKAIELDGKDADSYAGRAWANYKAKKLPQALSDASKSLDLKGGDANVLDTRAHIYEALGRREEAIADFRRALEADPELQSSKEGLARLTTRASAPKGKK